MRYRKTFRSESIPRSFQTAVSQRFILRRLVSTACASTAVDIFSLTIR